MSYYRGNAQLPVPAANTEPLQEDTLATGSSSAYSELIARMGYASKVVYAGRTYGSNMYSLSPSLSYYHKSGLFSALSGYWYSGSTPQYAMTDLSLGYLKSLTNALSFTFTYDRFFFTPTEPPAPNPIANSLDLYGNYDFGPINLGLDYAYLFGQQNAKKLNVILAGYIPIEEAGFFDRIIFTPSLTIFWGTENVTLSRFRSTSTAGHKKKRHKVAVNENKFGLMSYDLAFPVRFQKGNTRFLFTYHYVVPQILIPEYDKGLHPLGYFTASVSYVFKFRRKSPAY